jgi:hypothetical protein
MGAYQDIATEIVPIAATACSLGEAPSGMINTYSVFQGVYKSFVEEVKAGRIALPCLVSDFGDFTPDTEFGLNSIRTKRVAVAFHYITQIGGTNGTQDGVCAAAEAIGLAFDDHPGGFTTVQVFEPCTIQSNIDSPIMAALAAGSKAGLIGASVSWTPGFQVELS